MYPSYLIHFNRNHDPKSGRFSFGDGDGDGIRDDHHANAKEKYGGKKRKDFIKDLKGQYKAKGYSSYKSSKYAKTAADQNQWETYQYNKSVKNINKISNNINEILNKNNHNLEDVRIQKLAQEYIQEYKRANELEILLDNDLAVGELFTRSYADALSGVPKYNKDTNMKVRAVALLDH